MCLVPFQCECCCVHCVYHYYSASYTELYWAEHNIRWRTLQMRAANLYPFFAWSAHIYLSIKTYSVAATEARSSKHIINPFTITLKWLNPCKMWFVYALADKAIAHNHNALLCLASLVYCTHVNIFKWEKIYIQPFGNSLLLSRILELEKCIWGIFIAYTAHNKWICLCLCLCEQATDRPTDRANERLSMVVESNKYEWCEIEKKIASNEMKSMHRLRLRDQSQWLVVHQIELQNLDEFEENYDFIKIQTNNLRLLIKWIDFMERARASKFVVA